MATETISTIELFVITSKLFGDTEVTKGIRDVAYMATIPLVCIKRIIVKKSNGAAAIIWKGNPGIYRVTDITNIGNKRLWEVYSGEVTSGAAAAFIIEIYKAAISRKQMRRWVFEILPRLTNGEYGYTAAISKLESLKKSLLVRYLASLATL